MEGLFFNVDNGYVEGIVRGYGSGLLGLNQYSNLTQCDSLDDLKLQLSATDYGNFLASYAGPLSTSVIHEHLSRNMYLQFQYIRAQSSGKLAQFLDFITYGYMIDNVSLMITGTLHERDRLEILSKCHPLGWFDTLPTLSIALDMESLYNSVLVDTPLAPFFKGCISADDLDDLNIEIIRNRLYKNYLEAFAAMVETSFDQPDRDIMMRMLNFEADRRVINVTVNSMANEDMSPEDKLSLFPSFGLLYPTYHAQLSEVEEIDQLKIVLDSISDYQDILSETLDNDASSKGLEDWFYLKEMRFCKDAFTQQFTLSTMWVWLKSKEQEIRNITWIAECIAQNQKGRIDNYISVY